MNAFIASVLSELDSIFLLEEEQRTAPKAYLDERDVFTAVDSFIYYLALLNTLLPCYIIC